MSRDIFDDRHGFAAAREAFVTKARPSSTPSHVGMADFVSPLRCRPLPTSKGCQEPILGVARQRANKG